MKKAWLIALVLAVGLAGLLACGQAWADSPPLDSPAVYIVGAGDTLYNIATRYRANVAILAQLNGMANPSVVYVGQRLIVPVTALLATPEPPGQQQAVVHVVQPGETLFRIALRYGTTVWAIVSANQLENPSVIYSGQRLLIPSGEAASPGMQPLDAITAPLPFSSIHVAPQTVVQGNVLVITVGTVKALALQGSFLDWIIPFAGSDGAYTALIGVHAMQKPGVYPLVLTATDEKGHQVATSVDVQILAGKFGQERINLPPDKQALLDPAMIQAEREKLWSVFGIFRQERYWSGLFILPVQGKISSVFGTRRTYSGGAFNSYHEGIDFSAGGGTPVYAPAAGIVVLAEPLMVRGTAVILDHGWGVHSGFYHLSEINVSPGQLVQAGELVGRVGSTGLSTGAHLHWDLRVRGVNVDPLEWTRRAIP
ncbi:MAG: LysM peptidoglycan-binding domain-containing protein [Thermoflexales bacterium]|nr:LysM peptidoglycan-binding domain-containing protein [Thermoflexales bacterium]